MSRGLIIGFFVFLFGCAELDLSSNQAQQPEVFSRLVSVPKNVPICETKVEFAGFRGGVADITGVASISVGPYHFNDMMYIVMGPMAQEKLIIANVGIKNTGSEQLTIDRHSLEILGEDDVSILALEPEDILILSRGTDVKSKNPFHELGGSLIKTEFSMPAIIDPGEKGTIMVAFPLPLSPKPRFVVSVGNSIDEIPICWGL